MFQNMSNRIMFHNGSELVNYNIELVLDKIGRFLGMRDLINSKMWNNHIGNSIRSLYIPVNAISGNNYFENGGCNLTWQDLREEMWSNKQSFSFTDHHLPKDYNTSTGFADGTRYSIPLALELNGFVANSNYQSTVNSNVLSTLVKADLALVLFTIMRYRGYYRSIFFTCKELYYYIDVYYRHHWTDVVSVWPSKSIYRAKMDSIFPSSNKADADDELPPNVTHLKILPNYLGNIVLLIAGASNLLSLTIDYHYTLLLDEILPSLINLRKLKLNCPGYGTLTFSSSLEYLIIGNRCSHTLELPPNLTHFKYLSYTSRPVVLQASLKHLYLGSDYLRCGRSLVDTLKTATNLESLYIQSTFESDLIIAITKVLPPKATFAFLRPRIASLHCAGHVSSRLENIDLLLK